MGNRCCTAGGCWRAPTTSSAGRPTRLCPLSPSDPSSQMIGKSGEKKKRKKKRIKENEKIKTKEGQGKESEKGNQGKREKRRRGEKEYSRHCLIFHLYLIALAVLFNIIYRSLMELMEANLNGNVNPNVALHKLGKQFLLYIFIIFNY